MRRTAYGIALLVTLGSGGLVAQGPQGPGGGGRGPAAGQTVEKIRELKPSLYMMISGGPFSPPSTVRCTTS